MAAPDNSGPLRWQLVSGPAAHTVAQPAQKPPQLVQLLPKMPCTASAFPAGGHGGLLLGTAPSLIQQASPPLVPKAPVHHGLRQLLSALMHGVYSLQASSSSSTAWGMSCPLERQQVLYGLARAAAHHCRYSPWGFLPALCSGRAPGHHPGLPRNLALPVPAPASWA